MKKNIKIALISFAFIFIISVFLLLTSCNQNNDKPKHNPFIDETPHATNILVNENLNTSTITGSFSPQGTLRFVNPNMSFELSGAYYVDWEFIPNDQILYNSLHGTVLINVFDYRLTFEGNGGIKINRNSTNTGYSCTDIKTEDIYYNESITISDMPLYAKNNYRFNGWSESNNSIDYISFPKTFSETITLYSDYQYHTADKLEYISTSVSAKYENPEQKKLSLYMEEEFENAISGEIIIADMINDNIISLMREFGGTKVTNVIYNNFVVNSGRFNGCKSLTSIKFPKYITEIDDFSYSGLESIYIPNSVKYAGDFSNCNNLEKVEFEAGATISYKDANSSAGRFDNCMSLKEVILNRFEVCSTFGGSNLETITLPETIKIVPENAFRNCKNLNEVEFFGEYLEGIGQFAFSGCESLKNISIPKNAKIDPLAFYSTNITNIDITDEQIQGIADRLHELYIGPLSNFENKLIVNCVRDEQYSEMNFKGEYLASTDTLNLYFNEFSLLVLDALMHEFFHYYQYIICYGVNDKTYESILEVSGIKVDELLYHGKYEFNPDNSSISIYNNPAIVFIIKRDVPPSFGNSYYPLWTTYDDMVYYLYMSHLFGYNDYGAWALVDEIMINKWKADYIPLLEDSSNWSDYWNQPFEVHARNFASYFSGVTYD